MSKMDMMPYRDELFLLAVGDRDFSYFARTDHSAISARAAHFAGFSQKFVTGGISRIALKSGYKGLCVRPPGQNRGGADGT
jgi:hypothetical protein